MRFFTILGGGFAAVSLLALFGFVLPEIETYKNQLLLLGPLTMLAGEGAQYELQGRLNALYLLRNIAIGGAVIGGMLFLASLSAKKKSVEAIPKTASRSSEYYLYVAVAALIITGAIFYFMTAGV